MTKSIVAKIWTTFMLLIIVVFIALGLGFYRAVADFYYSQIVSGLVTQGKAVINLYAEDPSEFLENDEINNASRIMQAYIIILNKNSIIQICNQEMHLSPGDLFEEKELTQIFEGKIVSKKGYHQVFGHEMLSVGLPIIKENNVEEALLIYTPIAPLSATLNSFLEFIYWGLLIAVILTSILAFFLSRTLSKPLIKMNKMALNLAKGDYSQRVTVRSSDEVGVLGASLNYLSEQLKKNITELSYEKDKIENILTSMSDGVITFDTKGKIAHFNPQAKHLLDDCVDVEKDKALEYCDYLIQLNKLFQRVLETEELIQGEIKIHEKIIAAKLSPLFNATKKSLIGVVTVLQDVTKERKLEEMRREFVANVSHELRTPISLIQGYAEAIIDDLAKSPEQRNGFLKVILEETQRLKRLVEDLLELSRLQSGAITLEKEWIDLNQIITQMKDKFKTTFKQRGIDFQVEIGSEAAYLVADRIRLEQVLMNLINNAIQFTSAGKILIKTKKSNHGVELSISDTGQGISEEDVPFIFERFYRTDKSRNRESGGTGIGLSIVKNIVDAHHGEIRVKSKEGEGTTFTIVFPSDI